MNSVNFVNLTPHAIRIINGDLDISIPPSGMVARVFPEQIQIDEIDGIPVYRSEYPDGIQVLGSELCINEFPCDGTVYVVSTLVLQAMKTLGIERADFVAPNTSPAGAIRDENGNIVAVNSFQVL